jgi:molybdopterin converting factor small subunit
MVKVSPEIRQFTGNRESIELEGNSIRDVLDSLVKTYPASKKWFFKENGDLTVWVIVNDEIVLSKDFDKPISEKDNLFITRIYGGG